MGVGTRVRWAAAIAAAAMFAGVWWSCSRRPNLERDAQTIVNAMLAGDADTFFEFVPDVEKERFGLSKEKTRKVFEKIVRPAFAGFRSIGEPQKGIYGPHQGYYYIMTGDAQGRRYEVSASPLLGERGGVCSMTDVVIRSWILDFVVKKDLPVTAATAIYARTKGVPRDREFLSRLGIFGVIDIGNPSVSNDWYTYLRWMEGMCRAEHATELRSYGITVQQSVP